MLLFFTIDVHRLTSTYVNTVRRFELLFYTLFEENIFDFYSNLVIFILQHLGKAVHVGNYY